MWSPWGSEGASWIERCERIAKEIIRRVKLEAKNDPQFVPPADDASTIIAARHFVIPPAIPPTPADDASTIIAHALFQRDVSANAAGLTSTTGNDLSQVIAARLFGRELGGAGITGRKLTFGNYLTGVSYNGTADVTIGTNATSSNTGSTIVARDGSGNFSAGTVNASLNGSAPAGSLTGATLAAIVTQSSLTTLGPQAEDLQFNSSFGLAYDTGGAADRAGTATLVAGTVTVNTTAITAASKVLYNRATTGGTVGHLSYTKVAGTSITFTSTSATETSSIDWEIITTY